ncbi:MAG: hypothetical protein HY094_01360 [Candidatus Melainabacteria bacterium]|nr:hypothetical protein [Candidatus Melainabacteria bacterium]
MVSVPAIISTSRALVPRLQAEEPKLEDTFPLAIDTLEKLILARHEIDDYGFPIIPEYLKLDRVTEREGEVIQYVSNIYAANNGLREKLTTENGKLNLNLMLKKLSAYNPGILLIQPVSFLDTLDLVRRPDLSALFQRDPRVVLSLITANDCGLKNYDPLAKVGALNVIIIVCKNIERKISNAVQIDKNLLDNISILLIIRKLLEQVKDKESDARIREHASKINYDIELLEEFTYYKCSELKREKNKPTSF